MPSRVNRCAVPGCTRERAAYSPSPLCTFHAVDALLQLRHDQAQALHALFRTAAAEPDVPPYPTNTRARNGYLVHAPATETVIVLIDRVTGTITTLIASAQVMRAIPEREPTEAKGDPIERQIAAARLCGALVVERTARNDDLGVIEYTDRKDAAHV